MNGPMDDDRALRRPDQGGEMALTELERLTGELTTLAQLLSTETRTEARWLILKRVQEIMVRIREGVKE